MIAACMTWAHKMCGFFSVRFMFVRHDSPWFRVCPVRQSESLRIVPCHRQGEYLVCCCVFVIDKRTGLWKRCIFSCGTLGGFVGRMTTPGIFALWGKAGADGTFHPLLWHMLDTAAVAEAFLKTPQGQPFLAMFSKRLSLDTECVLPWVAVLAALHDLGKACPGFQQKHAGRKAALGEMGVEWREGKWDTPHNLVTASALPQHFQGLGMDGKTASRLSRSLGGHHGVFPLQSAVSSTRKALAASERLYDWSALRQDLFHAIIEHFGVPQGTVPALPAGDNAVPVLLTGLVTAADWLASNDAFFPYEAGITDPEEYWRLAQERAAIALNQTGWDSWKPPDEALEFRQLFPDIPGDPRPVQVGVTQIAKCSPRPALVILEVPMGEGKTEAAMLLQEHWCCDLGQRGAYFALPTMATSNQMFERTEAFLSARYVDLRTNLHLLHGHALLSDRYGVLKTRAVNEDEEEGKVVADEWFIKPKRGLLAPFAVGTVDQALLSVLQTRHGYLRLFGLSQKTLIFDEVHAYDVYMSTLFERLLAWLASIGTTVVILSATLPASRRRALLNAYAGQEVALPAANYPRMTWTDEVGGVDCRSVEVVQRSTLKLDWWPDDLDDSAEKLRYALGEGGCAAWICNTVSKAQETYGQLAATLPEVEVQLFHARYPFGERARREADALRRYGKHRERRAPSILVATQVIEQSLDLDFDLMITELAPVDLVLQRAGRLHRHNRTRPPRLAEKTLALIEPPGHREELLSVHRSVYEESVLLRSWLALKDIRAVRIPEDMENLIEAVYGPEEPRHCPEGFLPALKQAEARREQSDAEIEKKARVVLIPSPAGSDVLDQWNRQLDEDDPDVHESLRALTRLSGPSVSVVCLVEASDGIRTAFEPSTLVDFEKQPPVEESRKILESTVTLSYRTCLLDFPATMTPPGWRTSSLLRHHRAAVFRKGVFETERNRIHLDPDLGIRLEWL